MLESDAAPTGVIQSRLRRPGCGFEYAAHRQAGSEGGADRAPQSLVP
jgi:hypothetical protein